jgi:hypothetical protein
MLALYLTDKKSLVTSTILSIASLLLAAFFKAVADTSADHFDTSVFKWWDRRFWDKTTAAKYAPLLRFTKYRLDAWHLANSGMIVCFCLFAVFCKLHYKWYYELVAMGILFNLAFNISYNKILRK